MTTSSSTISPASRDPAVVNAGHVTDGRRHEPEPAEVDVGQALENSGRRRSLNSDQTPVLLKLQRDVEPLTSKLEKCK